MEKQSSEELEYSITLEKLTLSSFRCFGSLDVGLDKKLTVFIAENGGGKTALLDAMALALKTHLAALHVPGYDARPIMDKDVKKGENFAQINLKANIKYIGTDSYDTTDDDGNSLSVNEPVVFSGIPEIRVSTSKEEMYSGNKPTYEQADSISLHKDINLPVLAYYGGDSVYIQYKKGEDIDLDKLQMVYGNALSSERFDFTTFYNWYKWWEDKAFRATKKDSPTMKTIEAQFQKLKGAIEFMLNDNPDEPEYTGLRINEDLEMGMDKKTPDGGSLFVEIKQFSSGERALFAFVADLGLRLLNAHPIDTNADEDHAWKIWGKGIVLIDEVDLHLHLKWQEKVIDKLMQIFPDIQWVMTTHSLPVLGRIRSENVRLLSDNEVYSIPEVYGQDISTIIEKIWRIPSSKFKPQIREVYRLLSSNDPERVIKAKSEVERIEREIGSSTPALIEAKTIIKHKEKVLAL